MIEHRSFGVLPVRRQGKTWEFFLVQHRTGHWSFPKGHTEPGETGEQTARRELAEETGIDQVDLHLDQAFVEEYTWNRKGQNNHKIVTYYLGLVDDPVITIQNTELADGRWIPIDEAESVLTFSETQNVFRQARAYILKHHLWS